MIISILTAAILSLSTPECHDDFPRTHVPGQVQVATGYKLVGQCAVVIIDVYERHEIATAECWEHLMRSEIDGPALPGVVHPKGCPDHIGTNVELTED